MVLTVKILDDEIMATLDVYERMVYIALCLRADERGISFPSISRLTKDTGVGKTKVTKAVAKFHLCGIVKKIGRVNHSTSYQVEMLRWVWEQVGRGYPGVVDKTGSWRGKKCADVPQG